MSAALAEEKLTVTTPEAATLLGVSAQTLRNWRAKGIGPKYVKVSDQCVLYAVRELHEFVGVTEK